MGLCTNKETHPDPNLHYLYNSPFKALSLNHDARERNGAAPPLTAVLEGSEAAS